MTPEEAGDIHNPVNVVVIVVTQILAGYLCWLAVSS